MRINKYFFFIGTIFFAFAPSIVLADRVPNTTLTMSTILQNVLSKGYKIIQQIEFKKNVYIADAINPQGRDVKVFIDAQTGKVTRPKEPALSLTMEEVVKKVESAGYHNIYKIEVSDTSYEIKALDKKSNKVDIDVDIATGKISKK